MPCMLACDATIIKAPATGVQNAVMQQLRALMNYWPSDCPLTVFAPTSINLHRPEGLVDLLNSDTLSRHVPLRILWQQLILPLRLKLSQMNSLHCFAYTAPWHCPVPYVLNVHDLIALSHPQLCSARNLRHMRMLLPHSARHATVNLASTRHGADELMRLLQIPASRIQVLNLGVNAEDFSEPALPCQQLPNDRPYLLFVSNIEPKKDLDTLLDAYVSLADFLKLDLVIVGRAAWKCQDTCRRLSPWQEAGRVFWLRYVPQESLPGLYQHALALVMPSLVEGFGLPVLEAMAAGTPVIHSDHPALMETAGGAGFHFKVHDPDSLADAIRTVAASSLLRQQLTAMGRERARAMTWDNWGRQVAQIHLNLA